MEKEKEVLNYLSQTMISLLKAYALITDEKLSSELNKLIIEIAKCHRKFAEAVKQYEALRFYHQTGGKSW